MQLWCGINEKIFVKLVHSLAHCIPLIILSFLPHLTQSSCKMTIKYIASLCEKAILPFCVLFYSILIACDSCILILCESISVSNLAVFPLIWFYVFLFIFNCTLSWNHSHFLYYYWLKHYCGPQGESRQPFLLQFAAVPVLASCFERKVVPFLPSGPSPWTL